VTDIEASAAWYQMVFGAERVPVTFPHFGAEESGYTVLLLESTTGFAFGLHHNTANSGEPFDESRTGLDHFSFAVAQRSDLDAWAEWLTRQGVPHSGVNDVHQPVPYSTVVFRDPDNIQLEFIHMPA
jgi:catechol 2,3-dioxygenase-like lactoylglutathione lyase family enzyme